MGETDIIERAEAWLKTWEKLGTWPIMRGLIDELKAARAENDRLQNLQKWYLDTFRGEASDG